MATSETASSAVIAVRRSESGLQDRFRAYQILVDGKVAGKLKRGQELELNVPPGRYSVVAKISWCSSEKVDVELARGGRASLLCRPASDVSATTRNVVRPTQSGYIVLEVDSGRG